jgi:hypothetical protein
LLAARQIIAAADCDLADGDGLLIRVSGASVTAVLRFTSPVSGSRREMGLGSIRRDSLAAAGESLAAVRNVAEDARRLLQQKRDPIEERERSPRTTRRNAQLLLSRSSVSCVDRLFAQYAVVSLDDAF